jgi:hypothetical protein
MNGVANGITAPKILLGVFIFLMAVVLLVALFDALLRWLGGEAGKALEEQYYRDHPKVRRPSDVGRP